MTRLRAQVCPALVQPRRTSRSAILGYSLTQSCVLKFYFPLVQRRKRVRWCHFELGKRVNSLVDRLPRRL
jgi:hypothetical protein